MALLLMESFDHMETTASTSVTSLPLKDWSRAGSAADSFAHFVNGRFSGSIAYRILSNSSAQISKLLPSTYTTVILGAAFLSDKTTGTQNLGTSSQMGFVTSAGALVCGIGKNMITNQFTILNASGTVIATTTRGYIGWNYLELKCFVNGASGTYELHINGEIVFASTVGNFGSTAINKIFFQAVSGDPSNGHDVEIDDVYVVDTTGSAPQNDFLGDVRIETLFPSGVGNSTAWTPNTGANWDTVNDNPAPDGDTTYVAASVVGTKDTYATTNLTVSSGTVFGIQTNLYARKDDATVRTIAKVIRQGGVDTDGVTMAALSSTYRWYSEINPLDPASAAWTISNINADEFGIKVIS